MSTKIGKPEPFEKPNSGEYAALLIDVIDAPQTAVTYGGVTKFQDQVKFVWALNAVDSKGRPFLVFETYNNFINPNPPKPSKLYVGLVQILQAAPPAIEDIDQLEKLVLGRASGLMILTSPKTTNPADFTSKVIGHMPLKPGQVAPPIPQGYVRFKNKTKQVAGPQPGQTSQTFQQKPATPAAPAVNLNASDDAF